MGAPWLHARLVVVAGNGTLGLQALHHLPRIIGVGDPEACQRGYLLPVVGSEVDTLLGRLTLQLTDHRHVFQGAPYVGLNCPSGLVGDAPRVVYDPAHVGYAAVGPMDVAVQRVHEDSTRGIVPGLQVAGVLELLLDGAMHGMGRVVVGVDLSDVYEEKMDPVGILLRQLVDKRKLRLTRRSGDGAELDHDRLSSKLGQGNVLAVESAKGEVRRRVARMDYRPEMLELPAPRLPRLKIVLPTKKLGHLFPPSSIVLAAGRRDVP